MEKLKKWIILIIILIILLILIFVTYKIWKNHTEKKDVIDDEGNFPGVSQPYEPNRIIEPVKNANKYYAVEKIIHTYITYIKQANGIIDIMTYQDLEVKQGGISMLYKILDSQYINEFSVTEESLAKLVKSYQNYTLDIKKIYVSEISDSISVYLVYATIDGQEFNLLVKADSINMTFSVFPQEYLEKHQYSEKMDENAINITSDEIEKNNYNVFNYVNISEEYIATSYFNSYKKRMLANPVDTYQNYFTEEYKTKRFGNVQNHQNYVNINKEEFAKLEITSYLVNTYDDYKEYVCKDQYDNLYIFKENAIMDYTVMLDTYTLTTEKFANTYNSARDDKKVAMNVDKVVQMLNSRDYHSIYQLLDDGFKSKNFATEDAFAKYMKQKLPLHYSATYTDFSNEGNIYVQKVTLSDISGSEATVEVNFIMQLKEGTDFVMSIEI